MNFYVIAYDDSADVHGATRYTLRVNAPALARKIEDLQAGGRVIHSVRRV